MSDDDDGVVVQMFPPGYHPDTGAEEPDGEPLSDDPISQAVTIGRGFVNGAAELAPTAPPNSFLAGWAEAMEWCGKYLMYTYGGSR